MCTTCKNSVVNYDIEDVCYFLVDMEYISSSSDTIENVGIVSLRVEIYSISTQNKHIFFLFCYN